MRLINIAEVVNEEEGKPPISITECECDLILDSIYRIIERSDLKKERIPIETEKFLNDCESKNIEKIGKDFGTHILLVLGENKDGTTRTVKYNRDKDGTLFSSVLDFF